MIKDDLLVQLKILFIFLDWNIPEVVYYVREIMNYPNRSENKVNQGVTDYIENLPKWQGGVSSILRDMVHYTNI